MHLSSSDVLFVHMQGAIYEDDAAPIVPVFPD